MNTNRNSFVLMLIIGLLVVSGASAADRLNTIFEQGKTAFVIITEPDAPGLHQMQANVRQAIERVGNAGVVEIDRTDSLNAEFVKKYELADSPIPLVLVFAGNGALGGGVPVWNATPEMLVSFVPSPKKAIVLKAAEDGQAAYVIASRKSMPSAGEVSSGCAAACKKMKGTCIAIDVDMDDPTEQSFLKLLKVDLKSTEPVTVVVNAQGKMTGSFTGPVKVSQLVQAASRKISSGCCPPGSGKTCPPAPTKKKGE